MNREEVSKWLDSFNYPNLPKQILENYYIENPPTTEYESLEYPEGEITILTSYSISTQYALVIGDYITLYPSNIAGWYYIESMYVQPIENLENKVGKKSNMNIIYLTPEEIKELIILTEEIEEESRKYAENLMNYYHGL